MGDSAHRDQSIPPNFHHIFPQLTFPQFDGSNPRLWARRAVTFFDMYYVPKKYWIHLATMNFIGSAAFWLQSIQANLKSLTWEELGAAMSSRFDRDEQNQIIRQFFRHRQTASVSEYIETFNELVHQMLAHDPTIASSVICNRFIDGLHDDIRDVVIVHRPQDLDTSSSFGSFAGRSYCGLFQQNFQAF